MHETPNWEVAKHLGYLAEESWVKLEQELPWIDKSSAGFSATWKTRNYNPAGIRLTPHPARLRPMRHAIIHYHEIALKGRNRSSFEQRLVQNIRETLRGLDVRAVTQLPGRIAVEVSDDQDWEPVKSLLAKIFGIVHFSLAQSVPVQTDLSHTLKSLQTAIGDQVEHLPFTTFRVSTTRADKRYPMTSMDLDREIGAYLCTRTGKQVKLRNPDLTIAVEMLTLQHSQQRYRRRGSANEKGICSTPSQCPRLPSCMRHPIGRSPNT